eukprot:1076078-Pelagomonas_calceolata.AAC.1
MANPIHLQFGREEAQSRVSYLDAWGDYLYSFKFSTGVFTGYSNEVGVLFHTAANVASGISCAGCVVDMNQMLLAGFQNVQRTGLLWFASSPCTEQNC